MGNALSFLLSPPRSKVFGQGAIPFHIQEACFPIEWDFIWVLKVGPYFCQGTSVELATASTMVMRLLHSNCEQNRANSKLLLPSNLNSPPAVHLALETQLLGPIDWILALAVQALASYTLSCCLRSSSPFSGPASIPLTQLTSFWAGRDQCADGVRMNVQVTNQRKCRWEHKV